MKKFVSVVVAMVFVLSGMVYADVFASRIKITNPNGSPFDGKFTDGTGLKVSYILNDTATSVELKVYNAATNAVTASVVSSPQKRGMNSISWDGNGSAGGQKYYVKLQATQKPHSDANYTATYFQITSDIPPLITRGIYTRGLDINNNMDSRGFGYWYSSSSDPGINSGYKLGTLRYNPDGSFAGSDSNHPILKQTLGTANGGTFDWGGTSPWSAAVDSKGRVYQVSNGGNFVTRMDNDSAVPKIIIRNIISPRGLYAIGDGANLNIYIAADTVVWRANIGNSDTLSTALEMVASVGAYVRDVILDDDGNLLVAMRTSASGVAPGYIERFNISGTLPKKRVDALFSISYDTGLPVCFALQHGPNKNSASDDTLYYSVRSSLNGSDTNNIGIHQLTNLTSAFPDAKRIFKSGDVLESLGGNNNANADIALDWAGNIIWFENANEEIFMIAPPRAGTIVTQITKGYDTVSVQSTSSAGKEEIPSAFTLNQNYPNPFNPATMISYTLPAKANVSIIIYDILGNVVNELFSGEAQQGYNAVVWNSSNASGAKAASGMYLYRITAQLSDGRSFTDVKRMLLLK